MSDGRLFTEAQLRVRTRMLQTGKPLVRRAGGYWCLHGEAGKRNPIWWTGTHTVKAMVRKGQLVLLGVHTGADAWRDHHGLPGVQYAAEYLQPETAEVTGVSDQRPAGAVADRSNHAGGDTTAGPADAANRDHG